MGPVFAFDPGTHATGWAVFNATGGLAACGVLLAPPTGENRRDGELARRARAVRSWRKRRKARLAALARALLAAGLLPAVAQDRDRLFATDPWALRHAGLTGPLGLFETGRALLHLASRRGPETPSGIQGRPPIEVLWPRHDHPVRQRRALRARRGAEAPELPTRADVEAEFAALWTEQARHHALLRDATLRASICGLAFGAALRGPRPPAARRGDSSVRSALAMFAGLCRALADRFGPPSQIACEKPLPLNRGALAASAGGQSSTARRRARLARRDGVVVLPEHEVDHVAPLAAGGRVGFDNEALSLRGDNRRKGAAGFACGPAGFARRRPRDMAIIGARLPALLSRHLGVAPLFVDPVTVAATASRLDLRAPAGKSRSDWLHNAEDAVAVALAAFPFLVTPPKASVSATAGIAIAPRRRPRGRMHEETFLAPARTPDGRPGVALRKAVAELSRRDIAAVRDACLRDRLVAGLGQENDLAAVTAAFSRETGVRRLRIVRPAADAIPLPARAPKTPARLVLAKANHAMDIVALRDGAWRAFGITLHERLTPGWRPRWERLRLGGKLVMRLCRNDLVEIDQDGGRCVLRVQRLAPSNGYVWLADPAQAGELARRHADPADPFRFRFLSAQGLQMANARAIDIDPAGRRRARPSNAGTGPGEPDPAAPETGRPTATDSVCHQAPPT